MTKGKTIHDAFWELGTLRIENEVLRKEIEHRGEGHLLAELDAVREQLRIEQASSYSCRSCGLLWPEHEEGCGLWTKVTA